MNFQIGQEVEIVKLPKGRETEIKNDFNIEAGDTGVISEILLNGVILTNPKFKNSCKGDGKVFITNLDKYQNNLRVLDDKPKALYEDSGRNKLRLWLKAICKKYGFTLEQLSVNLGFNESYLSNVGSKSRFEKRGDINSEEYRKLVNNFLVDDYKECRHTIAHLIEQIDSLDDDFCDVKFKYDRCIYSLEQANKNTEYWMRKLPKTRFQAFKLFIKMIFGGQP